MKWTLLSALVYGVMIMTVDGGGGIAADEDVVCFPVYACWNAEDKEWRAALHGWIFERESDSAGRAALIRGLHRALGLSRAATARQTSYRRLRYFVVDNERGKQLSVRVGKSITELGRSAANGHFTGEVRFPANDQPLHTFQVVMPAGDKRRFTGEIDLIPKRGVSVISDIDDTIKQSEVLDRKKLLANTFCRAFSPVKGMSECYAAWQRAGCRFHYVTGSPWQLYVPLRTFFDRVGYPRGSFHMKDFRVKDRTVANLLADPEAAKKAILTRILQDFPQRRFVLVGDSGEKDASVYAAIARRHPQQVAHIYIRAVIPKHVKREHFAAVFKGVAAARWSVFRDGSELPRRPAWLQPAD